MTPAAPAIVLSPKDRWLEERRRGVGASEVAAILGEDPRRGALAVYADKVAGRLGEDEAEWMAFGRDVESAIAKGYGYKTGRAIIELDPYEIVRHPDVPVLGATLDRRTLGSAQTPAPAAGEGALELKSAGWHKVDEWATEPPLQYAVQVQAQMACAGLAWGSLGAMFGGVMVAAPADMLPNQEFVLLMLARVERFWWHVENRVPPPADAKPQTYDAIRRLWRVDDGSTIALDHDDARLVEAWELAKARRDDAAHAYHLAVNRLAVRMGNARFGYLPDGSSFVYASSTVAASRCACGAEIKKESTRRTPGRFWPRGLRPLRRK